MHQTLRSGLALSGALLAAACLTALPASAQTVPGVDVTGVRPTTVTLNIAGKSPEAVRRDVRQASYYVCRNAVANAELDLIDLYWCSDKSSQRAMKRYGEMVRTAAVEGPIVLSVR